VACLVELRGEILEDKDKACAEERKCLGMVDATRILHEFACSCLEDMLHAERKAGREPDPRSWKAVQTKRRWLAGKATDEELDAAGSAAAIAAWSAAWSAAESVAESAAWSVAESVAGSVAESVAESAAESAAWNAAWNAARSAARSAAESAAESAAKRAEAIARSATTARHAHNRKLSRLLLDAMGRRADGTKL